MECVLPDSVEVFVADDAFEGDAVGERQPFDDFELIGEGDTREGALLECTNANSLEVFVEDDVCEGGAFTERQRADDFELIGESDTRKGGASLER